jgi:hypothetical protein
MMIDAVVAYFKVLCKHLAAETYEGHEKYPSEQRASETTIRDGNA